jgi:TIR domain-containing protein
MAHDVFVSYSSHDKPTADALVARLEAAKLRCWIAPRDILPGMEWGEAIIDGIHRCRVMVLVFSASANASPQIRREVERAVNRGIPIIPFRIEEVMPSRSLEYFLSSPHWLDALTPPVEAHIQRLAEAVRAMLSRLDGTVSTVVIPPPPGSPRASVRRVLDTVFGGRSRAGQAAPVSGLAPPPGGASGGARRLSSFAGAPAGVIAAFGALLVVAVAALILTRSPSTPVSPVSRVTAASVVPRPTPAREPTPDTYSVRAAAPAPAAPTKIPRVYATYVCRRGAKFSIDPDKATVTIDGHRVGIAEDFYHHAYTFSRSGTHYARLSLRGYRSETVKIVVRPTAEDENTDVKLDLRRSN